MKRHEVRARARLGLLENHVEINAVSLAAWVIARDVEHVVGVWKRQQVRVRQREGLLHRSVDFQDRAGAHGCLPSGFWLRSSNADRVICTSRRARGALESLARRPATDQEW